MIFTVNRKSFEAIMIVVSSSTWRCVQIAPCVFWFALAASGYWVAPFRQQQQTQPPIFRTEHNEVDVVVIVRDGEGRPVSNLTQSDFAVRDNGKLQTISSFAADESRQPAPTQPTTGDRTTAERQPVQRRFVALFFDDVHTEPGDFARVQVSAERFVQESLQRDDRVAIFRTSKNDELTFTNDKSKLVAAIDALRVHPAENSSKVTQCPRITNYEAYLIVNNLDPEARNVAAQRLRNCMCPPPSSSGCPSLDNLKFMVDGYAQEAWQFQRGVSQSLLAALDLTVHTLGTMPGRRMLLLSSSGFLSGDLQQDVDRVIDDAVRAGVVINALSAKGLLAESPGGNLSEQRLEGTSSVGAGTSRYEARQVGARMEAEDLAMTDFAQSTGGRFFKNNNDFLHAFNELTTPEVSYRIAFSPKAMKQDGRFHHLKVEVSRRGHLTVYARSGYFAPTSKEAEGTGAKTPPAEPMTLPTIPASAETSATATRSAAAERGAAETPNSSPGQEENHQEDEAKKAASPPSQPTTAADVSAPSSSSVTEPTSVKDSDIASEREFLNLASREVGHYIETFADLTADETRIMHSYDEHGFATQERSMRSALVIYRLRSDPKRVAEYREVISVDGHEVKGHETRAAKLWRELAEARSTEEEIKRIRIDSERYDIGLDETGLTLFEGLPLRSRCEGDFVFKEVRRELSDERHLRVFTYRQVHRCDAFAYHFRLPIQFGDSPLVLAGVLALDAKTGQIVHEEQNVYSGGLGKKSIRVAHLVMDYGKSGFSILVPKAILIETFLAGEAVNRTAFDFRLHARWVQTYGPFSRFEVSTGEKVSAPAR
jgi:VWFA-related protein